MNTTFQKIPLTDFELSKNRGLTEFIKKGLTNWKLVFFFLPVFLLLFFFKTYINFESLIKGLLPIFLLFSFVIIAQFLSSKIEIKLGYKKVGKIQVWRKIDLFFIKIIFLKNYLPLFLAPQTDKFPLVKAGSFLIIEKTGLNRLLTWEPEKIASH